MIAYGAGSGYVLGGTLAYQTSPQTTVLNITIVAISGLFRFDMASKTLSNSACPGRLRRFKGVVQIGAMHYVPSFGPKGLFIVMDGD